MSQNQEYAQKIKRNDEIQIRQRVDLKSGYSVESIESAEKNVVQIKAPDGRICLDIKITPQGPVVEINSVSLKVAAQGDLAFACRNLEISAENRIALRSKGDLVQTAGGDIAVEAQGSIETEAFSQSIKARLGDIELDANDDVMLDGERIRLNSPRPPVQLRRGRYERDFRLPASAATDKNGS